VGRASAGGRFQSAIAGVASSQAGDWKIGSRLKPPQGNPHAICTTTTDQFRLANVTLDLAVLQLLRLRQSSLNKETT